MNTNFSYTFPCKNKDNIEQLYYLELNILFLNYNINNLTLKLILEQELTNDLEKSIYFILN